MTENALKQFTAILKTSMDLIVCINKEGVFTLVSESSEKILGYTSEEMTRRKTTDFIHPDDIERSLKALENIFKGEEIQFENRYIKKDGTVAYLEWTGTRNEDGLSLYAIGRDTTHRKKIEESIQKSEEQFRLLFLLNPMPMWIYDTQTFQFLEVNKAAIRKYGYSREEFLNKRILDIRKKEEAEKLKHIHRNTINGVIVYNGIWQHIKKTGEVLDVEITSHQVEYYGKKAALVLAYDVTEKIKVEKEIKRINERLEYANKATFDVIWDWDLISNEVFWSDGYQTIFGHELTRDKKNPALWKDRIHENDRERVVNGINTAIKEKSPMWNDEYRYIRKDGSYAEVLDRGILIMNPDGVPVRMVGAMQDITKLKETELALRNANDKLEKKARQLATSNTELERFAYVASHDLQEPLRMVSSFLQLLEKKYKDKLDETAIKYIHYAVDGAERMKDLIKHLLEFSRLDTNKDLRESIDINETLPRVLSYFGEELQLQGIQITMPERLPVIFANRVQMEQLFQNLLSNCIKYKHPQRPLQITLNAHEDQENWNFSISDNGIGIDEKFFDKVFLIFKRLHHKETYPGAGIGLAVCKKIVEHHGGKIWLESSTENGTTFYFSISKH